MPITVNQQAHAEVLRAVFAKCHDPADWKGPIDVIVPWDAANVYMQAIEFMTGVKPRADRHTSTTFHLTCVGYRMGPAGG